MQMRKSIYDGIAGLADFRVHVRSPVQAGCFENACDLRSWRTRYQSVALCSVLSVIAMVKIADLCRETRYPHQRVTSGWRYCYPMSAA